MPDSFVDAPHPIARSPTSPKEAVVYQTRGSQNQQERRQTARRYSDSHDNEAASNQEMRISALGSDKTVPLPSGAETRSVQEITDKVSVIKLAETQNVVCITETKGNLKMINELAKRHNARAIIHTGDFGFHDSESYKKMHLKELRNMVQFGPLSNSVRSRLLRLQDFELRKACEDIHLSELYLFLSGQERFDVPVYVVWGNQEDVHVLKKFADGSYHVPNLYILNQDSSFSISLGVHSLRLFGLGGSFMYHRFFDIGQGTASVSGADGSMWSTLIQVGNLIELADRYKDPNEIRILVSHVSPGKEGLINQVAAAIKADFTVSGALHGKFCHAYTDFSVRTLSNYLEHVNLPKTEIPRIWAHVKSVLGEESLRESDRAAVKKVLDAVNYIPQSEQELKHIWHLNLPDVKQGHLLFKMANDDLQLETVVEHGWHLSIAKEHFTERRRSSTTHNEKKITPPKPEEHRAEESKLEQKIVEKPQAIPSPEPTPVVHVVAEEKSEPIAPSGQYVVKVSGFPSGFNTKDLEKVFKYFKASQIVYDVETVTLNFAAESEFMRAQKSISQMVFGGIKPTLDSTEPSPEAIIKEIEGHIESTTTQAEAAPASAQHVPVVETVQEPAKPVFGQRRANPVDLNIDSLGWGN